MSAARNSLVLQSVAATGINNFDGLLSKGARLTARDINSQQVYLNSSLQSVVNNVSNLTTLSLADLQGEDGADGADGRDGVDGI